MTSSTYLRIKEQADRFEAALGLLPTHPDSIAAYLSNAGHVGIPSLTDDPIVRYLEAQGVTAPVHVANSWVRILPYSLDSVIAMPEPVVQFVYLYDAGEYPELIASGMLPTWQHDGPQVKLIRAFVGYAA